MTAPASRNYPVPRAVCAAARPVGTSSPLFDSAVAAAQSGRVRRYHLPILADGGWSSGRTWAQAVLAREADAADRKRGGLLASIGYDPDSYVYHGILDPSYPDVELLTSVARTTSADSVPEVWDGTGWGDFDLGEDDTVYAVLDEATLAELLEALGGGSGGLILRPTEPRGWLSVKSAEAVDQYDLPTPAAPTHTGVMVALPIDPDYARQLAIPGGEAPEDLHITLAYLGDLAEEAIDYQAVQRAVAKWARRMSMMDGEVSGPGKFTAGDQPVSVALVDIPALPDSRQMLVRLLEAEGVSVVKNHGYTPHITLAYADLDLEVPNIPMHWETCTVHYGDEVQEYELGAPMVAAGGAGPDPLYAIVDEFDTAAVLDLVQVRPGPVAYRRVGGKWVVDRDLLLRLVGVDPPPVVEVGAEQAQDVIAQVDAYDAAHPDKQPAKPGAKPVTAALWAEDLHPRKGGKFAKKNGGSSPDGGGSSGGGTAGPGRKGVSATKKAPSRAPAGPRGPQRPGNWVEGNGGASRGVGMKPGSRTPGGAGGPGGAGAGKPGAGPGRGGNLYNLPASIADSGVGPDFFADQPAGFQPWLKKFLDKQSAPATPAKKSTSNDNPDDAASKAARKTATKKANSAVKKAASGQQSNRPSWWDQVPKEYRGAMMAFLEAANGGGAQKATEGAAKRAAATERRVAGMDKRDRDFDLNFAKQGLGESQRREMADRQLQGLKDRLIESGADPGAVARLMTQKVAEEKRAREEFARKRRMAVEQERVRRLAMRNAETDQQVREKQDSLTADASMMPGKLKRYWSKGEGAAKIRWGVGGDFDRCRKALTKYLPAQMVSGACANLHHLALGVWPGRGRNH